MTDQKKPKGTNINIEIPEDKADGTYINLAVITHSSAEFILDFVNIMPGIPNPKVKSRILTNPIHAKRLMRALEDNINRYETTYGTIQDHEQVEFQVPTGGNVGIQA